MDLQDTFYVLGIIFMSLMLLIMIGIVIAIFVIKKKIDAIHRRIEEKLAMVNKVARAGSNIVGAAKKVARAAGRG